MDIDAAGQNVGLWAALRQIYARMSALRRRQMFLQLVLLLGSAIAELATIGAIMPFLALLADPRSTLWCLAPRGAVSGHPLILAAVLFTLRSSQGP